MNKSLMQEFKLKKPILLTLDIWKDRGDIIPRVNSINFFCVDLCIKILFFYLKISFIENMSIEI